MMNADANEPSFEPGEDQIRTLDLLIGGSSNKQIAAALHISESAVEFRLARLFQLTNSRGRVQLALWWQERKTERRRKRRV